MNIRQASAWETRTLWYRLADDGATPIPCEVEEFSRWRGWNTKAGNDKVRVAYTTRDGDEAEVSTVFLGLDHQFGDGPPVLWETLVFGGRRDGEIRRYTTRADAERGHVEVCQLVWPEVQV